MITTLPKYSINHKVIVPSKITLALHYDFTDSMFYCDSSDLKYILIQIGVIKVTDLELKICREIDDCVLGSPIVHIKSILFLNGKVEPTARFFMFKAISKYYPERISAIINYIHNRLKLYVPDRPQSNVVFNIKKV